MFDCLGDRIKRNYENRYRIKLTRRIPVILRVDGKAFHSVLKSTKNKSFPFDLDFINAMQKVARFLCSEIQGTKCAYGQSDEISLLITDFDKLKTDAWFDYNIQKMASISASMASVTFNSYYNSNKLAVFDSRVFNIPKEEVVNYFIWRQKDWIRNSVSMYTRVFFSHKDLHKKSQSDMHEMLHSIGKNWASDLDMLWKNGYFVNKINNEFVVNPAPIFTKNRAIIENILEIHYEV